MRVLAACLALTTGCATAYHVPPGRGVSPYVADNLHAAALKQSWASVLKFAAIGDLLLGTVYAANGAAMNNRGEDGGNNIGLGVVAVLVGAGFLAGGIALDSSAADNYEAIGKAEPLK